MRGFRLRGKFSTQWVEDFVQIRVGFAQRLQAYSKHVSTEESQ